MHLLYDLHLTNFAPSPLDVSRIEVLDADAAAVEPIATFQPEQLKTIFQVVGGTIPTGQNGSLAIPNGRTAVIFMAIGFDRGTHIPDKLIHRVLPPNPSQEGRLSQHITPLYMCSDRHWKDQTGLQPMARAMIPVIIIGAES